MGEQTKTPGPAATPDVKRDAKRSYGKPVVLTEQTTDAVVLAASSGCGIGALSEEDGCGLLA
jgi:hypothetical protein